MRKGRCRSTILQTCNMTPCSLYRPTSHNNTSSTSGAGFAETTHPDRNEREPPTIPEDPKIISAAPDETAVGRSARRGNHAARRLGSFRGAVLRTTTNSDARIRIGTRYRRAFLARRDQVVEPPLPGRGSRCASDMRCHSRARRRLLNSRRYGRTFVTEVPVQWGRARLRRDAGGADPGAMRRRYRPWIIFRVGVQSCVKLGADSAVGGLGRCRLGRCR